MLDIDTNRRVSKYSRGEMARRIIWAVVSFLFRWSPRPCFAWRRLLLRAMGAKVGNKVNIYPSARIYYPWMLEIGDFSAIGENALVYSLGWVRIGKRTTISQRVHLCAGSHDPSEAEFPLLKLPIQIGDDVWVCADAFIGPDVTVGDGAVVAACGVVFRDVEPWTVVRGNPAVFVKPRIIKT